MKQLILILLMVPVLAVCQSAADVPEGLGGSDVSQRDISNLRESVQTATSLSSTDTINLSESEEVVIQRRSEQYRVESPVLQ